MNGEEEFEEKQYLGSNKLGLAIRMLLAVFCFVGYYWSENPKPVDIGVITIGSYPASDLPDSGRVFFLLGLLTLLLSLVLLFILHIHIRVYSNYMLIDGFFRSRRVKIDFHSIRSVKKVKLKNTFLNSPTYNLYRKGSIRFFSSGTELVELRDRDGMIYRIGTQHARELCRIISKKIEQKAIYQK
jgi:hypothetical protein